MVDIREATNIRKVKTYDLNVPFQRVVQKGNVGHTFIYGLQLYKGVTYVYRGRNGNLNSKVLQLSSDAGGHTQTWEFAGNRLVPSSGIKRAGQWFFGTKPSADPDYHWAKQIARVDIRNSSTNHSSNTEFPRLAFLSYAGSSPYSGKLMTHAEAATSPDYTKFLIATIENNHIGHFTIYDLDKINQALDNAGNSYVSLENFPYQNSFIIDNLYGNDTDTYVMNSIQGFDIDNSGNIYISSQAHPNLNKGKWKTHHKQIIKIPYYARSKENEDQWETVNLSKFRNLDISGKHSEVESIQIIDENHCYLTVSYHEKVGKSNVTTLSKIYELLWD